MPKTLPVIGNVIFHRIAFKISVYYNQHVSQGLVKITAAFNIFHKTSHSGPLNMIYQDTEKHFPPANP
jgi:hypothetical protein